MLKVINLSAGYGKLPVIRSVSMSVQSNEVVALIGGNGAGKSTLLRSIAGLIPPSEGRVLLRDRNIAGRPAEYIARSGIVLVPEGRALFPGMTVYENLLVGANANSRRESVRNTPTARERTIAAVDEQSILSPVEGCEAAPSTRHSERSGESAFSVKNRLDSVYQLFPELKKRAASRAGELSGGQQQMLALGRALMSSPQILILDEPSTGLAPVLVKELFDRIVELRKAGVTLLIAEQNVHKALEVADRGYVIENGRIVLEDTAEALKSSDRVQKAYLGI